MATASPQTPGSAILGTPSSSHRTRYVIAAYRPSVLKSCLTEAGSDPSLVHCVNFRFLIMVMLLLWVSKQLKQIG